MWEAPAHHPLRRLFAGLTEHAFMDKFGFADPPLTDYLSGMLSRFVHSDAVFALKNRHGGSITELVEMVIEAEGLPEGGRTKREYHRHVGDFALFWTGVYPEALEPKRTRGKADCLINYATQGKRSYLIASRYDDDSCREEAPVLKRLAEEFDLCAVGLREVRREWEELRGEPNNGRLIQ
ncbi:MAG: hypothetical protein U0798_01340 [Gemmataceae bacterium]